MFYIRGNHDSFSQHVWKAGIPQGAIWEREILKRRGNEYFEEMKQFYNQLPYVALSKDYLTCHAAPPNKKVTLDKLINIHQYPDLATELVVNRLKRPNYPAGYTKKEVKKFRKALELPPEIPFIVGHNPLSSDQTVWLNVEKIINHHIVYSAMPHKICVFTRIGDKMVPLTLLAEPLVDSE